MHPDKWKPEVIREMSLNVCLEGCVNAVQECIAGSSIAQMIVGVAQLVLLFDGSLDITLCEPGMIHEKIHHPGGISQILDVNNSVYTCILKMLE